MATKMKAAVFVEKGRIVLEDKPVPDVGPNDALIRPERRAVARTLGADEVMNFRETDPVAAVRALTDGRGADAAIEALGTQKTFEVALRVLRPGGRFQALASIRATSRARLAPSRPGSATMRSARPSAPAARNACSV